jgi:hypothetical protein
MKNIWKQRTITGMLLLSFTGALAIANVLSHDKPFSETENRVLEQYPRFRLSSILSGAFTSNYERYTSDQFILRDYWVSMKTYANLAWGKKDNNGVFLGKDGYLLEQYQSPPEEALKTRAAALQALGQATPGLRKYLMIVPTSASLLADKLPSFAPVGAQENDLNRLRGLLPQTLHDVDVYSTLYKVREKPIFYKTDHHWTTEGAYYAYQELCKQMGIVPLGLEQFDLRQVTNQFYGSLSSKSGFHHVQPDSISLYLQPINSKIQVSYIDEAHTASTLYELDNLSKKDKYAVFLNGNHALIRITTDVPGDKRLLVVKDSYANSMIPFLTDHFREIDVVDLRYFNDSVLKLMEERQFQDMLVLYNIKTFFEDPSILHLSEELP